MKYTIDLHTHSISSNHAYSTLQEMAAHARDAGISMFALTDHGPALPGGAHEYHFGNLRILPPNIYGVEILKGIEANVTSERGEIDLAGERLINLDIVLAGFHRNSGYNSISIEKNTETAVNLFASNRIDIMTHPGNPEYPLDFHELVAAADKYNVAIEMNNSSFVSSRKGSGDNCRQLLSIAKEAGIFIALGSDSHISFDVGRLDVVAGLVEEIDYPRHKILNSSRELLADFLSIRH